MGIVAAALFTFVAYNMFNSARKVIETKHVSVFSSELKESAAQAIAAGFAIAGVFALFAAVANLIYKGEELYRLMTQLGGGALISILLGAGIGVMIQSSSTKDSGQ